LAISAQNVLKKLTHNNIGPTIAKKNSRGDTPDPASKAAEGPGRDRHRSDRKEKGRKG